MNIEPYDSDTDTDTENTSLISLDAIYEETMFDLSDDDLPEEIHYGFHKPTIEDFIDVEKIHYNDHFKRLGINHIVKKMPAGDGSYIPGWQLVLEKMAENISDSPLDEMIKLSVNNIYNERENTTILE